MTEQGVAPEPELLLEVDSLRVNLAKRGRQRRIVTDAAFCVAPGEAVAIVGESGSGKSVTARAVMGLLAEGLHAEGAIRYRGADLSKMKRSERAAMCGRDMTMILQDPFTMLQPTRRCGEQILDGVRGADGRRLSKQERLAEARRRLAEVGIANPAVAERYPFELSGGMRQRVALAAALAQDPQLLIADEPSTALDVTTQAAILRLIKSLQESRGMGLILITHDLRVAFSVCDRVYVFYAGSVMEASEVRELLEAPLHPYTVGLLLAEPPVDRRVHELRAVAGSVPQPDEVLGSCAFAERCSWAQEQCRSERPTLVDAGGGHLVACRRIPEIQPELREVVERAWASETEPAMDEGRMLVTATGVTKTFRGARRGGEETVALAGVDITIHAGQSVGVVGESGSGKTTLGRCLSGFEVASGGTVTIDGIEATNFAACSSRDRVRLRHLVQVVFQDPYSSLNPARTIGATLLEALRQRHGSEADNEAVADALRGVGLPANYARRRPFALSGGERQRVAIARALAMEPRLLVCDEAVSALDVSVQAQILNLLKSLRQDHDMAYLFITHDLAVVRQIADWIYVMHNGKVVEQGPTSLVLSAPKDEYTMKLMSSVPH
jgi:peptide/nickel transport system ATP-binding protein